MLNTDKPVYVITHYGTGMTPMKKILPVETTEEEAIEIARKMKANLWSGFSSLKYEREIRIGD